MNKLTILAAVAPIAMLAACGDSADTVDEIDADASSVESMDSVSADTETTASEPQPATRLDDASDASGTYTYTAADGKASNVTIDTSAGTYSYTTADGTEKTGEYERSDDGYRFTINDYNGRIAYFAFSDGDLVRLPVDQTLTSEVVVEGERYTRSDKPFSRAPELGSPVVPEDMTNE